MIVKCVKMDGSSAPERRAWYSCWLPLLPGRALPDATSLTRVRWPLVSDSQVWWRWTVLSSPASLYRTPLSRSQTKFGNCKRSPGRTKCHSTSPLQCARPVLTAPNSRPLTETRAQNSSDACLYCENPLRNKHLEHDSSHLRRGVISAVDLVGSQVLTRNARKKTMTNVERGNRF